MLGDYPGSDLPGRIVPDVLRVRAFEVRNPMPFFVLVKSDDAPEGHGVRGCEPGPGRISM
jgi:hypothetical protein